MRREVPAVFLFSSSNWNNSVKTEVDYRKSNNVASKSNHNIGTHVELRTTCPEQSPEQHFNQHLSPKRGGQTHSQYHEGGVSTDRESSPLMAGHTIIILKKKQ